MQYAFQAVGIVVALILVATFCYAQWRWQQARFRKRFPAISDDEFVARCAPGTSPKVALKVRRIIADQLGVDYERIRPDMSFVNDLDCC